MALSSSQRKLLSKVQSTPEWKRASPKERKALVEAGIVESGLRNLNYGDRDSKGFLQQRPSQGWKNVRDIPTATKSFLDRAKAANRPGTSAGVLAQSVQRSAYPDRYHQQSRAADEILGSPPKGQAAKRAASPKSSSLDRRSALIAYAQNTHAPGAVQALAAGLAAPSPAVPKKPSSGGSSKVGLVADAQQIDRLTAAVGAAITAKQEPGHAAGGDHDPAVRDATARDIGGSEQQRRAIFEKLTKHLGVRGEYGGKDVNVVKGGVRYQIISRPHGTGPHLHVGLRKAR